MAGDSKTVVDSWEACFQAKRALIGGLETDKLDRPTANAGWTVRNLATHIAIGSDGMIGLVAPKLAKGKGVLPVPLPTWLFTKIGDIDNGRQKKKHAKATPAELVKLMDATHAKGAAALAGIPADGWNRKGPVPTMGTLTVGEFIEHIVAHDEEHTEVLKKALA